MTLEISDSAAFDRASNEFAASGESAQSGIGSLLGTIDGLGSPWGGDEAGQAFFSRYEAPATTSAANASQVGDQARQLATNTTATKKAYQKTEQHNAAAAGTVNE